jgi:threonylcarbamoyladenosine tRNA methylthiotransferase MtaB
MINLKEKTAIYYTLGCKLNFAETSTIGEELKAHGVKTVRKGEIADICVINTCSVTEVADSKCRQAINRLVRNHPGAIVVVTGCYAQLKPEQVSAMEGVDLVLGSNEKGQIVDAIIERMQMMPEERLLAAHEHRTVRTADILNFMPSCSCGDRTRYFLKVQDGCDYYCTYCTIPFARGRSRNGSISLLVSQANEAAKAGAKEIVITGVNIGDFGKTTGESFLDLLKELDKVEGIERYRISSIEPNLLTEEVLQFCAQSRAFMPHFHIPLQSGSDEVLRLMRRKYDTAFFRQKIERVLQLMPDAFIGVDTIVGTRGETEELFADAYNFMASLPVAQYHVFPYSERPGTKALQIPHSVRPQDKKDRCQKILDLSEDITHRFYERYMGATRKVLLEHSKNKYVMHGFTDNYIRVEINLPRDNESLSQIKDNTIVDVRLGDWNADKTALMGEIVQ